jgi:very-short-patch-repair endonuclease
MSLNSKNQLIQIAKTVCRELRKNQTEAEELFWETVRDRKYHDKKFYRQYPIFYDLNGIESFFITDFYCHKEKLIIELDGKIHQYRLEEDKKEMR